MNKIDMRRYCNHLDISRATVSKPHKLRGTNLVIATDGRILVAVPGELALDNGISGFEDTPQTAAVIADWLLKDGFTHSITGIQLRMTPSLPEHTGIVCPDECPDGCQGCENTPYHFGPFGHVLKGSYLSLAGTAFNDDEDIKISFGGTLDPVCFYADGKWVVLMPMKLADDDSTEIKEYHCKLLDLAP